MPWMISSGLFLIPNAISYSLLAESCTYKNITEKNIKKALKIGYLMLIPSFFFLFLFGDKILLLFGKEYSENAFNLLQILAFSSFFVLINNIYFSCIQIRKRNFEIGFLNILLLIFTIIFSYLFLIKYNLIGIGYAWLASHCILCCYTSVKLVKYIKFKTI